METIKKKIGPIWQKSYNVKRPVDDDKALKIHAKLIIDISPSIENIPVVIKHMPATSTITETRLKRQYSSALQRWEYAPTKVEREFTTGGGKEQTTYPKLNASVTLLAKDGTKLWEGDADSAWRWGLFEGAYKPYRIGEQSEISTSTLVESAHHLGLQVVYLLIGDVLDFVNYGNQ